VFRGDVMPVAVKLGDPLFLLSNVPRGLGDVPLDLLKVLEIRRDPSTVIRPHTLKILADVRKPWIDADQNYES
jgi:hypothetical protein